MNKRLFVAMSSIAALASLCAMGTARAADVSWSVGIGAPGVGAVISNGPSYGQGYGYGRRYYAPAYAPAPVVYAPAPVYVATPRVVYRPAPIFYAPVPVVVDVVRGYRYRGGPVPYRGWAPPLRYYHGHHGH